MKKTRILSLVMAVLMCVCVTLSLCACDNTESVTDETAATELTLPQIWSTATYTEDAELGSGNTTIQVQVEADGKDITLTVKTNADNLGDALLENSLIAGEKGEYGLYVKTTNGMLADYDKDQTYWAFYKDGEYLTTAADATKIADGEHYEIVYTK